MAITTCFRVKCFNAYLDELEKREADPKKYCFEPANWYVLAPSYLINYLVATVILVKPEEFDGYPVFKERLNKISAKYPSTQQCPFTGKYWNELVFDEYYFEHVLTKYLPGHVGDINILY